MRAAISKVLRLDKAHLSITYTSLVEDAYFCSLIAYMYASPSYMYL
jgi:hypothetical protein